MKNTKLYSVWNEMRSRCNNPNDCSYARYGGKGTSVCEEWNDFLNFYHWAIEHGYEEGLTLDRINPSGNYEPSNCRWATQLQQQRNRGNNVRLEKDGVSLTLKEWCEKLGFSYTCAKTRYYRKIKKCGSATFDDVFSLKENYRNRRIMQYDLSGNLVRVWDKLADAQKAGYKHSNISHCCQGKLRQTQGYVWKYAD